MIEVKGPNVFKGYWRNPEKTRAEFRPDGFFITGDLGMIDARGYVHILGRGKDLIISGGFNVYPKEVESEIDSLPGVAESAVIGVPHPDLGEGVTAVVVCTGKRGDRRGRNPAAARRSGSPATSCPSGWSSCADLPRNAMGKVQKNLLAGELQGALSAGLTRYPRAAPEPSADFDPCDELSRYRELTQTPCNPFSRPDVQAAIGANLRRCSIV